MNGGFLLFPKARPSTLHDLNFCVVWEDEKLCVESFGLWTYEKVKGSFLITVNKFMWIYRFSIILTSCLQHVNMKWWCLTENREYNISGTKCNIFLITSWTHCVCVWCRVKKILWVIWNERLFTMWVRLHHGSHWKWLPNRRRLQDQDKTGLLLELGWF